MSERKIQYYNQIYRVDGKNVFLEVLNNAFNIGKGKVNINFVKYDDSGITEKIDIYIDLPKALLLCNDILSGKLAKTVALALKEGKFENKPVNDYTSYFVNMGGKNEEAAKREDGMALSKQFKIQKGNKVPWIFRAEIGPGKSNETGLIVPQGKAEKFINVPLTDDDLKIFALLLEKHINAYITHVYLDHAKDFYPYEKINIFKPISANSNKNK